MSDSLPNLAGAIDLSVALRPKVAEPGEEGGAPAASDFVFDISEAEFPQLVERSDQLPVLIMLWAPTDAGNAEFATTLGELVNELSGRVLLARVDANANPGIVQVLAAQYLPTLVAVIKKQPVPVPGEATSKEQLASVLEQILQMAASQGMAVAVADGEEDAPEPEHFNPHHEKAYNALMEQDFAAARAAYQQAIKENPLDTEAEAGLAQVALMERGKELSEEKLTAARAGEPDPVAAALVISDDLLLSQKPEEGFAALFEVFLAADSEQKDQLRARLLEYFLLLGAEHPLVAKSRKRLASLLY